MKKIAITILALLLSAPVVAFAARTQSLWFISDSGTYIQPQSPLNVLINGVNRYLNFGTLSGSTGYGFRDNGGTMEFKNNAGAWTGVGTGGSGGGLVTVVHTDGTQTAYNPSVSSSIGYGTTLMTAYTAATCGETLLLASSTSYIYNIDQGVLDLTKNHTCGTAISMIGLNGSMPEIDGGNVSSYNVIEIGNGTTLKYLTIRGTQDYIGLGNYDFPVVINSNNITAAIRYVNIYGTTDGIYGPNGNTGVHLTLEHVFIQTNWDAAILDFPGGVVDIYDSSINIVGPPAVGGTLRPVAFDRGVYNIYNTKIKGAGGTSSIDGIQLSNGANAGDAVYFYGGDISVSGAATSYEFDNLSVTGGVIYVSPNVRWTFASTSGTMTYSTSTVASYFTAASTGIASVFPYASTTAISATSICITGDLPCKSAWPTGSVSGGTAGMLTSWVNANTLTATSGPTFGYFTATSTTATSTLAGPLQTATSSVITNENNLATSSTTYIDWGKGNQALLRLGSAAMTVTWGNIAIGQSLRVIACNPAGPPGTITWPLVSWASGITPSQSSATSTCDIYSFVDTNATGTPKIFGTQASFFQ